MKALRLVPVIVLTLSGVLLTAGSASAAPHFKGFLQGRGVQFPPRFGGGYNYDCSGGNVPAGAYGNMTISGVCYMMSGTVNIRGNLTIAPGALLDNVTPGDGLALPTDPSLGLAPAGTPLVSGTVLVGGNVSVGPGAVLFLGCSPNISCPEAVTYDRIGGNLTATDALGVVVHSTSIGGSFSILGGGGGVVGGIGTGVCDGSFATDTPAPIPPLWAADPSLANGEGPGFPVPVYSDAEDNTIGGNLSIVGLQSCWVGAFNNQVAGSITIAGNQMGDPDAMEIAENLVSQNLTCFGDDPQAQFGDSGAAPNIVGGLGLGECGFNVQVPNPAPEAIAPTPCTPELCPPERISVSASSLGTYFGTHDQTAEVASAELATTASGQTLIGEVTNDALSSNSGGLNGSITNETFLGTVQPNGSTSFEVNGVCSPCSFDGEAGATAIRAYGTTSANGFSSGTFLIQSGGAGLGGLSTLAGWGTFSGWNGNLRVVEHLKIT